MHDARRLRVTIRVLMLAVASAGLLMAAGVGLWRRHERLALLTKQHEQSAAGFREKATEWNVVLDLSLLGSQIDEGVAPPEPPVAPPGMAEPVDPEQGWSGRAQGFDRLARYHANLGRKYRRAAARPWLPVEPDPQPPPEPAVPDGIGEAPSGSFPIP